MTGTAVEFRQDDRQVQKNLGAIIKRMENPKDAYEIIGETVRTSIVRNFEKGGRPKKWQELSPVTLEKKRGTKILMEQGMAGGLAGSITYKAKSDRVVVGTNKVYGAIHHFGGRAGRGRKVSIPARPYMMVQDEDWREIEAELSDFILKGA